MEGKVGFIGFGSMGGVLLRTLLRYGGLVEQEVVVATRSRDKLSGFISKYPGMKLERSNVRLAESCSTVFICVGTADVKGIIEEIKPALVEGAHIIYISGGLTTDTVAKVYDGKITRITPSLICGTRNCVTLVHHNDHVTSEEKDRISGWLSKIGKVKEIDEDQFEIGANLTSCAPAFMAAMMKYFAAEAVRHSRFTIEEAEEMVRTTMLGTIQLLIRRKIPFDSLIKRVATEGGITEKGMKVIEEKLPDVFNELFLATLHKHDAIKADMGELYSA
ncbi:pyrroline-5-carboxylate reductase dimerization domain-containing protein [Chloroflexota bacterium]